MAAGGSSLITIGKSLGHTRPETTAMDARLDLDGVRGRGQRGNGGNHQGFESERRQEMNPSKAQLIQKTVGDVDHRAIADAALHDLMQLRLSIYWQKGGCPLELWYMLFRLRELARQERPCWKWPRVGRWLNRR